MAKQQHSLEFFRFLNRESKEFGAQLLWLTAAAGIINGIMVAVLVTAAPMAAPGNLNFPYLLMFGAAFFAFYLSKRHVLNNTNVIVEGIVDQVRIRIADKVRKADLLTFEKMDSGLLQTVVSTHTMVISQASGLIINAASSVLLIIVSSFYILMISKTAFLLTLAVLGGAILIYMSNQKDVVKYLMATAAKEGQFYKAFDDLLKGFKELKLNSRKDNAFFESALRKSSMEAQTYKIKVGDLVNRNMLLSQTTFYVLLAVVIFILPNLEGDLAPTIIALTSVILFIVGPISEMVTTYSFYTRATVSVTEIDKLEQQLETLQPELEDTEIQDSQPLPFEHIECKGISFHYNNGSPGRFQLGPVDFTLEPGKIVFIVGGNGSGKSTFIKLFTGLYPPSEGSININGRVLGKRLYRRYRNLFSPVFSDFHLFDQIYGIYDLDEDRIDQLIHKMELQDRTKVTGRAISNTQLSTGQRKRLALVLTMVEDKPIFIFDEWAADQDPTFRRYFYKEILPQLKAEGKTILAATHDDKYFDVADEVYKFEEGKMHRIQNGENPF